MGEIYPLPRQHSVNRPQGKRDIGGGRRQIWRHKRYFALTRSCYLTGEVLSG